MVAEVNEKEADRADRCVTMWLIRLVTRLSEKSESGQNYASVGAIAAKSHPAAYVAGPERSLRGDSLAVRQVGGFVDARDGDGAIDQRVELTR